MKVLYFGTVCDLDHYERVLKTCKKKPTVATVVFESAMLQGFKANGADMEVHSFPMVPTVPTGRLWHFGGRSEELACGYRCRWLRTINLPVLKQWSRRLDARRVIRAWAADNAQDGIMLTYSIPPFLVRDVVRLGKKYGIKTAAIVPDLPQNMYLNHKKNPVIDSVRQAYLRSSMRFQGAYDGYIYLTEAMRDVIAPQKPYIVMEGIFDVDADAEDSAVQAKASPKAIMYAGRLHEKYGVFRLIDAFEQLTDSEAELWLFGDGTAVEEIERRARQNPRIRYFGRVTREEILQYERQATLLVNPRSVKDAFTKYSFPSKTIEYMYSGTPLLTTRLGGIPQEYYEYVLAAEDNEPSMLAEAMNRALAMSDAALSELGCRARDFIQKHKNAAAQSKRVLDFLSELSGE